MSSTSTTADPGAAVRLGGQRKRSCCSLPLFRALELIFGCCPNKGSSRAAQPSTSRPSMPVHCPDPRKKAFRAFPRLLSPYTSGECDLSPPKIRVTFLRCPILRIHTSLARDKTDTNTLTHPVNSPVHTRESQECGVRRPQGRPPPPPAAVRRARFATAPVVADLVPGSGAEAAEATGRPPPHPSAGHAGEARPRAHRRVGARAAADGRAAPARAARAAPAMPCIASGTRRAAPRPRSASAAWGAL